MSRIFILLLILSAKSVYGQELFPNNESASTMPKNVFGARLFADTYNEAGTQRNLFAFRVMYGLLPKLTVMVTATGSNHHNKNLPKDLITHTHVGNSTVYYATNIKRGVKYPYLFNGFNIYAKYRFITIDGEKKHFRVALYGEWSNVTSAHDETEPNLLDDTRGWGGGLITTWLKKRFAVSLTSGIIIPGNYEGTAQNLYYGLDPIPTTLQYGRALKYSLSFGYLLSPKQYEDYNQPNWNIYLELSGKAYQAAKVYQYSLPVEVAASALKKGYYVDIQPGVQKIYNANLRFDFSVSFDFVNRSYSHFYPVYLLGVQKYFY